MKFPFDCFAEISEIRRSCGIKSIILKVIVAILSKKFYYDVIMLRKDMYYKKLIMKCIGLIQINKYGKIEKITNYSL